MDRYFESYRGHVLNDEVDLIGHMNIQFYAACVSQAMQSMFLRLGFPADQIKEKQKGFAAVDQKSRFCAELLAGDLMHMQSAVADFTAKSVTIHHRLINSATDKLSYETLITALHFDMKARKVISFEADAIELLTHMKLPEEINL